MHARECDLIGCIASYYKCTVMNVLGMMMMLNFLIEKVKVTVFLHHKSTHI